MTRGTLRAKMGYGEDDFILLYIAEFIPRKNHKFLLESVPFLRKEIPELKVILAGRGVLLKQEKIRAVQLEIDDIVRFLGYRRDINNLCRIADVYVSASHQEGLPISVVEAMASGLPVVASNIRGHCDVIQNGRNGFLYTPGSREEFCGAALRLYRDKELRAAIGQNNVQDAQKYSVDTAVAKMARIYKEVAEE